MTVVLEYGDLTSAGHWNMINNQYYVKCPKCGHLGTLNGHEVHEDGTVEPSVECPNPRCNFHDEVRLNDV